MAERRRGLGRGLGALIPDVVSDERPVDVFFPAQEKGSDVSRETSEARSSKDPAVSMRRARAEKKSPASSRSKATTRRTAKTESASVSDTAVADESANSSTTNGSRATSMTAKNATAGTSVPPGPTGRKKSQGSTESAGADTQRSPEQNPAHTGPGAQTPTADQDQHADSAQAGTQAETAGVSRETSLESVPGTAFGLLPVDAIAANPRQPRSVFDEDALDELVHSIREVGVLQPIVVRVIDPEEPRFELIMGERRLRASREAGLESIPAIIRQVDDVDLLRDALLENLHRADLNPLEEAAAYQQLLDDFACTQEELSERIGRSRPQITNTLRLLKLPPLVQRRVAAGVISQGHARAILGLIDPAAMEVLAQRVVAEGLSVRATEEAVVLLNRGDRVNVSRETRAANPELSSIARDLGDRLDTRVNITMGKRKGKISVEFANEDDLKRILQTLGITQADSGDTVS
ncbi:ParB/RepB/Spo0J family partition protein [Brevibacterium sp. R8603A2]|uniref:ParB/RepB/Spo0J family partition protein n=1 Tax=Brevibacterium sp. R8603A2 TaxID=2929779 RepID=UPI001FF7B41F|nr:ParB/RepB/Spo0J family partition protein [Brevibacterium sp. R8603A2]MCK1802308.1 ParB/RepB/Spo0J family partition protein [Brevibacterium sp. R8603A2]